ncbi:hypothetical protein HZ326_9901 [Fusarium oxysporum f. sp. albedinis]|nr:hypothetical protein HZ326_9901 [Fusarium oxysporum f. sp. albedinis]
MVAYFFENDLLISEIFQYQLGQRPQGKMLKIPNIGCAAAGMPNISTSLHMLHPGSKKTSDIERGCQNELVKESPKLRQF